MTIKDRQTGIGDGSLALPLNSSRAMGMKVHFFQIESQKMAQKFKRVLDNINSFKDYSEREMEINNKSMFLERMELNQDFLRTNFAYRRINHGPGLSKKGQGIDDFDLDKDTGFAEETAAVWFLGDDHPHVAIQYNHYGPRQGAILKYLSEFPRNSNAKNKLEFIPVTLDSDNVLAKLRRGNVVVKTLEFKGNAEDMTNAMFDNGIAHFSLIGENSVHKVDHKIEITLSCAKRSGFFENGKEFVERLLSEDPDKLRVKTKNKLDDTVEMLDLLEHRLVEEVSEEHLKLTTPGRRLDVDSRFKSIETLLENLLEERRCV